MAGRKPSPEQERAKCLYLESDAQMLLKDIADEVGKSPEQIRKWKSNGKWDDLLKEQRAKGNVTKSKSNVTKSKKPPKQQPEECATSPPSEQVDDEEAGHELTPRQLLFVQHYVGCFNATQAATRAGYSEKSAAQLGWQLLQKPAIQQAIYDAQQPRLERLNATADDIVGMLAEIGLARNAVTGQPVRDPAQIQALRMLAQINGLLKPKDGPKGGNITVVFDPAMEDDDS